MQFIKKFSFSFALFLGLLFAGAAVAWSGPPSGGPPTCPLTNSACNPPINTSSSPQTKIGNLSITGDLSIAGQFQANGGLGATNIQVGTTGNPAAITSPKFCIGTDCKTSAWDEFVAISRDATNFTNSQLTLRSLRSSFNAAVTTNLIGAINFDSNDLDLTAPGKTTAAIRAVAASAHTATSLPTSLVFYTTAVNDTTPNEVMRITYDGNVQAAKFVYPSDERLKTNIKTLGDALSKVLALRGVSFVWKNGTQRAGQEDIGFIAQEVEKIAPELVATDERGYKAVDYARTVPLLVNAIREQQAQIDELKARLDALAGQSSR